MKQRKLTCIVSLLLVLLLLASCGPSTSTSPTPTPTPTKTATPTPSEGEENPTTREDDPHGLLEDAPDYKSSDLLGPYAVNGDVPPSKLPLIDKPEEIVIWESSPDSSTNMTDLGQGEMWKEAEKRLGVSVRFITAASTSVQEAFNLHIASQSYADILSYTQYYVGGIDKALDDGVFTDLSDWTDYIPHYMAVIGTSETTYRDSFTDSGRMGIFASCTYTSKPASINGAVYRRDMWEKSGLTQLPETWDEWTDMLVHFRDNMNMPGALMIDSLGVSEFNSHMLTGLGLVHNYIMRDGKVEYARVTDEYRTYLTYMSNWYDQNLIYQDFYSKQAGGQYSYMTELCCTDQIFTLNGWTAFAGTFYYTTAKVATNPEFYISAIKDPVMNKGELPISRLWQPESLRLNSKNGWAVTSAANTELCMRFLDYFYSTEGIMLASYGFKGSASAEDTSGTYYYRADGTPILSNLIALNPDGLAMSAAFQKYAWHLRLPYSVFQREYDIYDEGMAETIPIWSEWSTTSSKTVLPTNYAPTADEGAEIATLMADIETYVKEMTVKFITGMENIETGWDAYKAKIENMSIARVCELQQQAVDRYLARG